ncbi:MAG: gluconokinase [Pseudomonadota bacterium]
MTDRPPHSGPQEDNAVSPSILVVIGVSGSGKTTVASMLANRLGWEFEDADWFHPPQNVAKMESGTPLTDEDRWAWLGAISHWIGATHAKGHHGVVACSALKRAYRDILVGELGNAVRIVYLHGTRALIGSRLSMRHGHFMPPELLDSQFGALEEPAPDEHAIIVSIDGHPRDIVENIVDALETETERPLPDGP